MVGKKQNPKPAAARSATPRQRRRTAGRNRREASRRIARGKPDSLCWKICKWKALYAAPVEPGSDAEKYAMMYPMQFVRLWCGQTTVEGNYVDLQLAAIRAAGGLELLGIALQLLRMAARRDRFGGRLVDHLGHVASLREIALDSGVSTIRMQAALKTLSGPRIAFVEQSPSVEVGTPISLRTASREAHTPNGGDGRTRPSGGSDEVSPGRPESAGDRESRQVGGPVQWTGSTAAAAQIGAPAGGLPASRGPPGAGGSGGDENRGGTPKEQEQEQEQEQEPGQEAGQGQESAAPRKKKKIGMPEGAEGKDPQAQAREAQSTGTSTSTGTGTGTGTGQPIADVPMAPTGADPGAPGKQQTTADGGVDEAAAMARHVNSLTLAVYDRVYPTAQFESTEALKADNGRGLGMRQFKAREQGELASVIAKACVGMTAAQRSEFWAWATSTADSVYAKDHRRRRNRPLASVWTWRLNQHRHDGRRDAPGGSGPT